MSRPSPTGPSSRDLPKSKLPTVSRYQNHIETPIFLYPRSSFTVGCNSICEASLPFRALVLPCGNASCAGSIPLNYSKLIVRKLPCLTPKSYIIPCKQNLPGNKSQQMLFIVVVKNMFHFEPFIRSLERLPQTEHIFDNRSMHWVSSS